jgi:hypothetical protein
MTARGLGILAGGAVVVAALALLARPMLPKSATSTLANTVTRAAPPAVERLAQQHATRDLRCRAVPEPDGRSGYPAGCGSLQVTRRAATCTGPARCQVDLVADLHTAIVTVPVALTVSLIRIGSHWRVVEVSS